MKNKAVVSAALLAVAIVVLGFTLKAGIDNFTNRDRVVTVRGLCEKEVNANKVTWPVVTKEVGNDLPTIYAKIERSNSAILSYLKGNGISDGEISVNAPSVYDYAAERYGNQDVRYRYQVTNVVVVTSDKIGAFAHRKAKRVAKAGNSCSCRRLPVSDDLRVYRSEQHQAGDDSRGHGQCPRSRRQVRSRFP